MESIAIASADSEQRCYAWMHCMHACPWQVYKHLTVCSTSQVNYTSQMNQSHDDYWAKVSTLPSCYKFRLVCVCLHAHTEQSGFYYKRMRFTASLSILLLSCNQLHASLIGCCMKCVVTFSNQLPSNVIPTYRLVQGRSSRDVTPQGISLNHN